MTRYTKDHEWVRLDGTTATVGISVFAQKELGDITLEDAGRRQILSKGDTWVW